VGGLMHSFQQFIDNVFQPLFDVTLHPDAHPALGSFLQSVGTMRCNAFGDSDVILFHVCAS